MIRNYISCYVLHFFLLDQYMIESLPVLVATAASLAFVHTITGPDHYLPFIMIGRARRWSLSRTALLTLLCGVGHVGSSILIGPAGIVIFLSGMAIQFLGL